jgi:hypothetical protein
MRPSRLAALLSFGWLAAFGCSSPKPPARVIAPIPVVTAEPFTATPTLEGIVRAAAADPVGRRALDEARAALRVEGDPGIVALLEPCDPERGRQTRGVTTDRAKNLFVPAQLEDLAMGRGPAEIERSLAALLADSSTLVIREPVHPDYAIARAFERPRICVVMNATLSAGVETLVHELTHAAHPGGSETVDPLAYADANAFLIDYVLAPGGEVDAFIAGIGARARREHGSAWLPTPLAPLFDANGDLTAPRKALALAVLATPPEGLGYGSGPYAKRHAEELDRRLVRETFARDGIAKLDAERVRARAVCEENAQLSDHNVGVYADRASAAHDLGRKADETKALADRDKEQAEAARWRKLASAAAASHARLMADLTERDGKIAGLRAASAKYEGK